MLCWVNGEFLKNTVLKISPFDYGFLYGYNVVEIFRTYNGKVVLFQEHFNRLTESLMSLRMKMPYSIHQLERAIEELTKRDNEDAIVHLCVSLGQDFWRQKAYSKPKVLILRSPLNKIKDDEVALEWKLLPWRMGDSVIQFFGKRMFTPYGMNEGKAIYYNDKDIIVGGFFSTIFWGKHDILYTPKVESEDYYDITRKWVKICAKQLGLKVIEGVFIRSELEDAYECFLSNSIDGIVPVSQVKDKKFLGKEGPIYEMIHHAYLEEIFQIKGIEHVTKT